jgi:hypothetical protein
MLALESHAANLLSRWADEASSGTHPCQATIDRFSEKPFSVDQDKAPLCVNNFVEIFLPPTEKLGVGK